MTIWVTCSNVLILIKQKPWIKKAWQQTQQQNAQHKQRFRIVIFMIRMQHENQGVFLKFWRKDEKRSRRKANILKDWNKSRRLAKVSGPEVTKRVRTIQSSTLARKTSREIAQSSSLAVRNTSCYLSGPVLPRNVRINHPTNSHKQRMYNGTKKWHNLNLQRNHTR